MFVKNVLGRILLLFGKNHEAANLICKMAATESKMEVTQILFVCNIECVVIPSQDFFLYNSCTIIGVNNELGVSCVY